MDFHGPPPKLIHIADMRINVPPPMNCGATLQGIKQWFEITSGSILSLPSRSQHKHDGHLDLGTKELFKFSNTGLVKFDETTIGVIQAQEDAKSTEFGKTEVVQSVRVNTNGVEWGWLNFATLVGQSRLVVEEGVLLAFEVRLFRVEVKVLYGSGLVVVGLRIFEVVF
jgi:hypothetical protein